MREFLVSRGVSEFLFTNGAGLIARNSWTAEFNQAPTDLAHGVLARIPRPVEGGQRNRENAGGEELEQHMSNTHKQALST